MKHLFLSFYFLFVFVTISLAQDPTIKTIKETSEKKGFTDDTTHIKGWRTGGVFTLNAGQGSSKNWAAGAEKFSLSLAGYLSVYARYKSGRFKWENTLDLGYAMINTTSNGLRKTDDKIDLYSKAGHALSEHFSLAGVVNFRTQFAPGYDYDYLGKDYQKATSNFMAPAYLIVAPGIDYHPAPYFNIFVSPVSARFVIVTNEPGSYFFPNGVIPAADGGGFELPLAALYGVNPQRKVRTEVGGFASITFNKELFKNVSYKSRMDLYSNYLGTERFTATGPGQIDIQENAAKPQNVDVFWTNLIVMKVNKILNVTYNFDLIYDDDVRQFGDKKTSAAIQLRSLLAVGLSVSF
ncbi:DUF3078 domain-containing protein [Flavitalea sp.]|nr:DUF3078 domain-containing protein [Flavitalea sp.]